MRDAPATVFEMIAQLMERKARLLLIIVALGVIGIVIAQGLTWTSSIVILIAVVVIPSAWLMLRFWSTFCRSLGRRGGSR